jgi:glycosyltransferase involved in cell wall biosynthesis
VIVVDDGSSKDESEFLIGLKQKFKFRTLSQENSGQAAARNFGISESGSEYICLLDQDDYFFPDHIKDLLEVADINDPRFGFAYGDLWRVDESDRVLAHSCINIESQHPHTQLRTLIRTNMYILPSATLIKKSAFLDVGGFDPQLRGYEDDDLFLRMFVAGYINCFTPKAVTVWTLNNSSTSFSESMGRSRFIYCKKLIDTFPEGSVAGLRIFGDLIHPRFGLYFIDDLIGAVLKRDGLFAERSERLAFYAKRVEASSEISPRQKTQYLIVAKSLLVLPEKVSRFFLVLLLSSGVLKFIPGSSALAAVVRKYLPRKKVLTN